MTVLRYNCSALSLLLLLSIVSPLVAPALPLTNLHSHPALEHATHTNEPVEEAETQLNTHTSDTPQLSDHSVQLRLIKALRHSEENEEREDHEHIDVEEMTMTVNSVQPSSRLLREPVRSLALNEDLEADVTIVTKRV